jgi:hypothetical protein
MGRIERTVFISYRRTDEAWALAIFENLTKHGYDVFVDYDGLASGNFETAILENIKARAHFLVLLTPTALEPRRDKDWMRLEIEAAMDHKRNIVPLMLESFSFGTIAVASQLTGKLATLKEYNGLEIPKGYFPPAMDRLRNKFLNLPVDAVLHSASVSARQAAAEQKDKVAGRINTSRRPYAVQVDTGNANNASEAAQAWAEARNTTNQLVLEAFIKYYENTFYASLARARLEELKLVGPATPPPGSALARAQVEWWNSDNGV